MFPHLDSGAGVFEFRFSRDVCILTSRLLSTRSTAPLSIPISTVNHYFFEETREAGSSSFPETPLSTTVASRFLPPLPPLLYVYQRHDDAIQHGQSCRCDLQIPLSPANEVMRSVQFRNNFLFVVVSRELRGPYVYPVSGGRKKVGPTIYLWEGMAGTTCCPPILHSAYCDHEATKNRVSIYRFTARNSELHSLAEKSRTVHEFIPFHLTPIIDDPVRRQRLPFDPRNFCGCMRHELPLPIY